MDFNTFRQMVHEEMKKRLPDEYELTNNDVLKLNGRTMRGIVIKQGEKKLCPTVYLDDVYESYRDDEITFEDVIDYVNCTLDLGKLDEQICDVANWLCDWEQAKEYLTARLVNKESNQTFLEEHPHKEIADLSIIFSFRINTKDNNEANVWITNTLMRKLGQTEDSLYNQAMVNIQHEDCRLMSIEDILFEARRNNLLGETIEDCNGFGLYVLTNEYSQYGASAILSPSVRKELITAFRSELYVLPASLHEVILLRKTSDADPKCLGELVREVNHKEVRAEDFLSNNVYLLTKDCELQLVA